VAEELSVVGKRLPLKEAYEKVTGRLRYPIDVSLTGMLHAKVLRSPYAHARIVNIDTSKAESLPGVEAIITHRDAPQEELLEVGGSFLGRVLDARVRFYGDEVAAVAAKDKRVAEEALNLIEVQYEELPHVFDIEQATTPDAPLVLPRGNVQEPTVFEWGDIENGFAEADLVVELKTTTGTQQHGLMGRNAYIANWEAEKLTVWSFTQWPSATRDEIARILKMPQSKVRVINLPSGTSFGAWRLNRLYFIPIYLAKKAMKPVKLELTQEECFATVVRRETPLSWGKLGLKKDGSFIAMHAKHFFDNGAYCIKRDASQVCSDLWSRVPHGRFEMHGVSTNLVRSGAMRGVGNVTMNYFVERLIDMAAEKLGVDPIEIRLKNCVQAGEVIRPMQPFYNALRLPYPKEVLSSCGLEECIRKGAETIGWKQKWKGWGKPVEVKGTKRRGLGMAISAHASGVRILGAPSAIVKVNVDGSVHLLTGIACMGQGNETTQAQIVAEELGVPFDSIVVTHGDTETCPWSPVTAGSSCAPQVGLATQAAAADAKQQLCKLASGHLNAKPEDLDIKNGIIYIREKPEEGIPINNVVSQNMIGLAIKSASAQKSFSDVFAKAKPDYLPGPNIIIGRGTKNIPESPTAMHFMAHFVEVEVDTQTGEIKVLRYVAAQDSGRIINPEIMENQVAGGVILGCGFALIENLIFDRKTGRVLNSNFLEYKILTALDLPDPEIIFVETYEPVGPFGVKGGGEGPTNCPAPAIAQAIHNAIGLRLNPPFTIDKIIGAMKTKVTHGGDSEL